MKRPFNILMVDDMQRYHDLFASEINDAMSATVAFSTSGEDALKKLSERPHQYDLLLLDLNLPGIGGRDVLRRLRADPQFDDLPIIILTGNSDQTLQSQLFAEGANEFIEKGSAPEVFVARLKAQAKHKMALDQLTQLAVDREAFAAGVLHDIRNIEMNLIAACELIEMQLRSDAQKNMPQILADLASFKEQIRRIDSYASSVIQKVREGHDKLQIGPVHWRDVLDWVQQFVTGAKASAEINLKDPEAWPRVQADRHLLQLAALNIVQNSIKYARQDSRPQLDIAQTSHGDRAILRLRDYGIGVAERDLRKIFEPFYRAHSQKEAESHGLGLSMVANVVGKMGGRVWAENPGDDQPGTAFFIELPLAASEKPY